MKTNNYKIVVLSELKENVETLVESAFSMAKKIGGEVHFFHVKSPLKIVENDNQLSAMRALNRDQIVTKKRIDKLLNKFAKKHAIKSSSSFAIGNVKEEIKEVLRAQKPDLVILGKRKSKVFSLLGDRLTEFLVNQYRGPVFISADSKAFNADKTLSLGILNGSKDELNFSFADYILDESKSTIKSFQIGNTDKASQDGAFVFEDNDSAKSNLSNYVENSNIDLLCIKRKDSSNQSAAKDFKKLLDKLNVSMLVSN